MPTDRTMYMYHFKLGNKIVRTGITSAIDWLEGELKCEPGWEKGHIFQVGFRTTLDEAYAWLCEQEKKGKPVRQPPAWLCERAKKGKPVRQPQARLSAP